MVEPVPSPGLSGRPVSGTAVLWMILGSVSFATMWVFIRFASADVHSFEIVFFRNIFGALALLPLLLKAPGLLRTERMGVHLRRGITGFIATIATFYAVANAPLATALSINYTAPLFTTLGAVLFLGERIRARRVAALGAGFLGMLLVLRPGVAPLSPGIVAAIISALFTAASLVTVRSLVSSEDSRTVVMWSFLLITPPSLVLAIPVWTWPDAGIWPYLVGIGLAAAAGQLSLSRAFKLAEASAVLPYDFVRFGLISLAGIFLFGERVDALTLSGGAIILGSSIYIAVREAQVARQERSARSATGDYR